MHDIRNKQFIDFDLLIPNTHEYLLYLEEFELLDNKNRISVLSDSHEFLQIKKGQICIHCFTFVERADIQLYVTRANHRHGH